MVKAIILAAGLGKRLRPITSVKPKCLVEVEGIALLDLQIKILRTYNIDEIIIVGGYLSTALINKGDKLIINKHFKTTNMVSSLMCAIEDLHGDLIISYGDILYSPKVLKRLLQSKSNITVVSDNNWKEYWFSRITDPIHDLESFKIDKNKNILDIGKKITNLNELNGQYIGLTQFKNDGTQLLKDMLLNLKKTKFILDKPLKQSYLTDMLQYMIDSGIKMKSLPITEPWIEIDTLSDLSADITKERILRIRNELLNCNKI